VVFAVRGGQQHQLLVNRQPGADIAIAVRSARRVDDVGLAVATVDVYRDTSKFGFTAAR